MYVYVYIYIYSYLAIYTADNFAEAGRGNNLFIDCSGSGGKKRKVERGFEVCTCINPSHQVYSAKLQRYVKAQEFLGLQGIWRDDFDNPSLFDQLVNDSPDLGQSFAGNSFTSTMFQASLLASLVMSTGWRFVGQESPSEQNLVPSIRVRAKTNPRQMPRKYFLNRAIQKHILKRKEPAPDEPRPNNGGKSAGNKSARGKKSCLSIWDKEQICKEYDAAKAAGVTNLHKHMKNKNMPGWFRSCTAETKWGKQRRLQQWSLLCVTAPKLARKFKEPPNSLRQILGLKSKHSHWHNRTTLALKSIPQALQQVIDEIICERIELGEEVQMPFCKGAVEFAISLWNEAVEHFRDNMGTYRESVSWAAFSKPINKDIDIYIAIYI